MITIITHKSNHKFIYCGNIELALDEDDMITVSSDKWPKDTRVSILNKDWFWLVDVKSIESDHDKAKS